MSDEDDSYLFDSERPRFLPQDEDVLAKVDDLELLANPAGFGLRSNKAGADLSLDETDGESLRRALSLVDGRKTLREIAAQLGGAAPALSALVRVGFGVVLFAPSAVERLERALSGTEITRFPGSPYEIVRTYWENMIAVRANCGALESALETADGFREFLCELNVTALTGADRATFYTPKSPIAKKGVRPGQLLTSVSETVDTNEGTRFVSGPRVNVKLLGGEQYHRLIYERAGDPGAADAAREVSSEGLPWGRVVWARAETDADFGSWFCPPRPFTAAHFDAVREALRAAVRAASANTGDAVRGCARFHWCFVRLHPFSCANQSIAMNLVNFVLGRAQGAGIPHLLLDQLALRLTAEAYQRVFETAVLAYSMVGVGPLTRYRELRARKLRAFEIIERLARAPSLEGARELVTTLGHEARLALMVTAQ